jgi:hypothetical protein
MKYMAAGELFEAEARMRPADGEYCRFQSGSIPALRPRTAAMWRQKHVEG